MTTRLQIIVITGMVLCVLGILNMMRKKKIDYKYAFGWLIIVICILIVSIWPDLLVRLSNLLGIATPSNMLFFLGYVLSVWIIFSLSITISNLQNKVKKLTQEMAIIRKDMYDADKKLREELEQNK